MVWQKALFDADPGNFLAFNNTAVCVRDDLTRLHAVWTRGSDVVYYYNGAISVIRSVPGGTVAKATCAVDPHGVFLYVTWVENGREIWHTRRELATGSWDAAAVNVATTVADARSVALSASWSNAAKGTPTSAVAWVDEPNVSVWDSASNSVSVLDTSAIDKPDVTIAALHNHVLAVWDCASSAFPRELRYSLSGDAGKTWAKFSLVGEVLSNPGDPHCLVTPTGDLLVAYHDTSAAPSIMLVRYDAQSGKWEKLNGGAALGTGYFAQAAIAVPAGLFVVWEGRGDYAGHIMLSRSTDRGATFSPVEVDSGSNWLSPNVSGSTFALDMLAVEQVARGNGQIVHFSRKP